MKKILTIGFCFIISLAASAQYKKASFFGRQGRTQEVGTNFSFLSSVQSPILSIVYSGSLETSKKLSGFMDLELMMPGKFNYQAAYEVNGNPMIGTIEGEMPHALLLKYGVQYRFINTGLDEEKKWVPYARLGLLGGIIFSGDYKLRAVNGDDLSHYTITPNTPEDSEAFWGLEGGVGVTYYVTKNFGVKVGGMYRQLFIVKPHHGDSNSYNPLQSHPGLSISLKYRMFSDE